MSLFTSPAEHAANPPETWRPERAGRRWHLVTEGGITLDSFDTKRATEEARTSGFCADLYAEETRWYAGEQVRNWNPYSP